MIGIYKITNNLNGKSYIGLSKNIQRRVKEHFNKAFCENDKEYKKYLYCAIRKYGVENFSMVVLEECKEEELTEKEMFWIKQENTYFNGYNETIGGEIGNMQKGETHNMSKLSEKDVIEIRNRYDNQERLMEVYEDYKHKIQKNGFQKIWRGETWKHVKMEVYTQENKNFHRNNSSMKGSNNGRAKLTEQDVIDIRKRRDAGETAASIYTDYSNLLKYRSFYNVYAGYNWKHIKHN